MEEAYTLVKKLVYKRVHPNNADDVVQNVMLSLIEHDKLNEHPAVINTITLRRIIDWRRCEYGRASEASKKVKPGNVGALDKTLFDFYWGREDIAFDQVDARLDVELFLSRLSSMDRELVRLRYLDELTFEEIAKQTGVSESTVYIRLRRVREEARSGPRRIDIEAQGVVRQAFRANLGSGVLSERDQDCGQPGRDGIKRLREEHVPVVKRCG